MITLALVWVMGFIVGAAQPAPTFQPTIVISLHAHTLEANLVEGAPPLITTVSVGRPGLDTPVGTFHVLKKQSPYLFTAVAPKGSKNYFPPSWVHYSLLFSWGDLGGFYIHDAPWVRHFGHNISHGCVNVPLADMRALYWKTPIGTTLIIRR